MHPEGCACRVSLCVYYDLWGAKQALYKHWMGLKKTSNWKRMRMKIYFFLIVPPQSFPKRSKSLENPDFFRQPPKISEKMEIFFMLENSAIFCFIPPNPRAQWSGKAELGNKICTHLFSVTTNKMPLENTNFASEVLPLRVIKGNTYMYVINSRQ